MVRARSWVMAGADDYLKDVLGQVIDAYETIKSLGAAPADLEAMRREWLRARGLLVVISGRLESSGVSTDSHTVLLERTTRYIADHDFEHEFRMLMPTYSDDADRVRNMQYKILESFEDGRLVEKIRQIMDDL